jgi:hypothetical protein
MEQSQKKFGKYHYVPLKIFHGTGRTARRWARDQPIFPAAFAA